MAANQAKTNTTNTIFNKIIPTKESKKFDKRGGESKIFDKGLKDLGLFFNIFEGKK